MTLLALALACGPDDDGPRGHRRDDPPPPDPNPPAPTNVLLVLLDDVGVEKLGLYGSGRAPATPTIDGLAAQGVLFERAYARPLCLPSRASLQTGRFGRRTGAAMNWPEDEPWELPLSQISLPEVVAASPHTYATAVVGKWHLAGLLAPSGLTHALATGWGWHSGSFANLYDGFHPQSYFDWDRIRNGRVRREDTYATTSTVDDAIDGVGAMPEPWLLLVSFNAAHKPVEAPPAELVPTPSPGPYTTYKDMIAAADTELARLLAAIGDERLARTHVVLTADNGTDGDYSDRPERAKGSLFERGVRVPFIVSGPAVQAPGTRSQAFVDLVDVWPTVAELAGADTSTFVGVADSREPYRIDGISLVPYLEDPTRPSLRPYAYNELAGPPGPGPYVDVDKQTIRDERYKLLRDNVAGRELLFEIADGALGQEGQDLLPCGLSEEQQAAYDRLRAELDRVTAELVYDVDDPYAPAEPGWMPYDLPDDTAAPECP